MAEQLAELNKSQSTSYSTTEVMTGETWIDGKKIYRRVFSIPAITTGGSAVVATILNILPIAFSGYAIASTSTIVVLPFSGRGVSGTSLPDSVIMSYSSNGNINVLCGSNRAVTSGYLVVDYIKTT